MAAAVLLSWGDLRHDAWLQWPLWVFDIDRMCVPWANEAGVAFWRTANLQQHAAGRVLLHQLDSTDAVVRNPAAVEVFGPLDDRPGASPLAALFADAADAEVLLATRLDERQRRHLQLVQQSAQTLMQIIHDLLDISRIEADKMRLRPAPLRLCDALHDSLAPPQLQAGQRGLALDWQVAPGVPDTAQAVGPRWCQVLLNLAGNALKFTHAGRIDVHLACVGEDSAGLHLACRVRFTLPVQRLPAPPDDQQAH